MSWLNLKQKRKSVDTVYDVRSDIVIVSASRPSSQAPHSTPRQLRLLGYPEEKKQNKTEKQTRGRESVCFHEWVSGGCITPSPATSRAGPCQLDLKWSCSEATARSCGSININAQGNATRAQKRNRFYLPSDPYTNLCKQNSLFIVLIQQSFSLCPGKKFMPLHNVSQ